MKRYKVVIGHPEGKAGDTIEVRAKDVEDAKRVALEHEMMTLNGHWIVLSVEELG